METGPPAWSSERFGDIDGSPAIPLRRVLQVGLAMAVTFAVAELVARALRSGDPSTDSFVHGLVFAVFGSTLILSIWVMPVRRARRARTVRTEFAGHLHEALEMAETESDVLGVSARAMGAIGSHPTELLLADHSRSHLRRAVHSTRGGGPPGCGVESPSQCPAVRRGKTLLFPSNEALDACPRFAAHTGGPSSAVCVPVTVLGAPTGVIHSTGAQGELRDAREVTALESLAMQAGSRLSVVRAMVTRDDQGATDPLTGQLNRRGLDEAMRGLGEQGHEFALALADLDHLELLNDTFGHETGDKALRLFARTLRGAVRDGDLVCRYGGEEFVVVFPRCSVVEAAAIVHRARHGLRLAVADGDVPAFTASFGLADSRCADGYGDVLRLADAAMFRAKQAGRDRLVIADEDLSDPAATTIPEPS